MLSFGLNSIRHRPTPHGPREELPRNYRLRLFLPSCAMDSSRATSISGRLQAVWHRADDPCARPRGRWARSFAGREMRTVAPSVRLRRAGRSGKADFMSGTGGHPLSAADEDPEFERQVAIERNKQRPTAATFAIGVSRPTH